MYSLLSVIKCRHPHNGRLIVVFLYSTNSRRLSGTCVQINFSEAADFDENVIKLILIPSANNFLSRPFIPHTSYKIKKLKRQNLLISFQYVTVSISNHKRFYLLILCAAVICNNHYYPFSPPLPTRFNVKASDNAFRRCN